MPDRSIPRGASWRTSVSQVLGLLALAFLGALHLALASACLTGDSEMD